MYKSRVWDRSVIDWHPVLSRVLITLNNFFPDVLKHGVWKDAEHLNDPLFDALIPDMLQLVLGSSAESTVRKYSKGWKRWSEWVNSKIGIPVIPTQSLLVAKYLTHLVSRAASQNQFSSESEFGP